MPVVSVVPGARPGYRRTARWFPRPIMLDRGSEHSNAIYLSLSPVRVVPIRWDKSHSAEVRESTWVREATNDG